MNPPSQLVRDRARLEALESLKVLDTPPDEGLDRLAELARSLLEVPVALVTLVDKDRQFFKSCLGLEEPLQGRRETPLTHSFCRHTIAEEDHLAIEDAREHPLVRENMAIRDLGVVAYLGIPLVTHDGQPVGSLCAIDHEPRSWSEEDVALLRTLATAAIQRLELLARVAELQEMKASLSKRETYFRALIERGMGAVTVVDRTGLILYTSPNSDRILGITPEEREGRSAFHWIHPDDLAGVEAVFQKLLLDPNLPVHAEFWYHHPQRDWIRLEGVGTNLLDEPAVGGVVFNFRDVTRERELEDELQQRRRLDTLGELTAGIAHDFNNLLAVVTANAELVRDGLRPGAEEAERDLADLQAAARGGAELIRSLMTFSRRSEPSIRPVDMAGVVEQAVRMLQRILPSRIRVTSEVASGLPPAQVDPRAMEQVILNLSTNARDAMPEGGILTLRLDLAEEATNGASDPASATENDPEEGEAFLRLQVSDTGTGMDQETLDQAFRPFFTTKAEGHGTGLGLAMIGRIVKQHRGRIRAESRPDEGTTMTILLPAAKDAPMDRSDATPTLHRSKAQELVLVVEDEAALRRTAQRVLERGGYRVVVASDGKAGLKLFQEREQEIAAVVSDQDMPEMSGLELMKEIRKTGSTTPFVLTTGYMLPELDLHDGSEERVTVLPKPWTLEELIQAVANAIGRWASPRQPQGDEHIP